METGSVYRAKYLMKWAGLILIAMPLITYEVFNFLIENRADFWMSFILVGIVWTFLIYNFVVNRIWSDIRKRHVLVIVKKVVNYHLMCISALRNEDYQRVDFILKKCLEKYDSASIITYFIKGAYTMGAKDMKSLQSLENDLKSIDSSI